jgi:carbonic anhydrase/SulP family sulfate permease
VEYGCAVAGAKLIVVMGHTRCGAVTAAVDLYGASLDGDAPFGCAHLGFLVHDIQQSIDPRARGSIAGLAAEDKESLINAVSQNNVGRTVDLMRQQSQTLDRLVREGRIVIVGAMYDVVTGDITFLEGDEIPAQARGEES